MTTALITGITGQDGSYLAEYLLGQNYDVVGLTRRTSTDNTWRIDHLRDDPDFQTVMGDLTDQTSLMHAVREAAPDEVYNLAAQSHVGTSFDQPTYTAETNALGVLRLLEAIREHAPDARFYQASTSELFGNADEYPQSETTAFQPESPYASAKLMAHNSVRNYRDAYELYAVSGILFNHESPRRGLNFVTRKITDGAAKIALGRQDELRLGNLDAKRDWGHARDYVRAMHLMLQQDPDNATDYVVGTGETQSVRKCARLAFDEVGLDYQEHVVVDEEFFRPADVDVLHADASNARNELGWTPERSFEDLIREMTRADLARVRDGESQVAEPRLDTMTDPEVSAHAD
jgi:GDPmannose 4,6-dehydratase